MGCLHAPPQTDGMIYGRAIKTLKKLVRNIMIDYKEIQ